MRIFISSTADDHLAAGRVADALRDQGHGPHFVHLRQSLELNDGVYDPRVVDDVLRGCRLAVCLISRGYVDDDWMPKELFALCAKERRQGGRFVIPVLVEDVPREKLRAALGGRAIVDLRGEIGGAADAGLNGGAGGAAFTKLEAAVAQAAARASMFVSHSGADRGVASALTDLLARALNLGTEGIRCTSVSGYRLALGALADERLRREATEADVFLLLVTPASVDSTYVMIEVGARWGAGLPIFPVLAAGASYPLPGPMVGVSALSCDDRSQVVQMVEEVAQAMGRPMVARASFDHQIDALVAASRAARPT